MSVATKIGVALLAFVAVGTAAAVPAMAAPTEEQIAKMCAVPEAEFLADVKAINTETFPEMEKRVADETNLIAKAVLANVVAELRAYVDALVAARSSCKK